MITGKGLHKSLGTYLRQKRMEANFTQAEVAEKMGYSTPQFISNFERGLCSPPLKNLKTLVRLYKIPTDELLKLIMAEQEEILRKAFNETSVRRRS